jgi:hypothetical protein
MLRTILGGAPVQDCRGFDRYLRATQRLADRLGADQPEFYHRVSRFQRNVLFCVIASNFAALRHYHDGMLAFMETKTVLKNSVVTDSELCAELESVQIEVRSARELAAALPTIGAVSDPPSYQWMKALLQTYPDAS